jgi:hypothetical protein
VDGDAKVEWSLACPGIGMDWDWSDVLISDFTADLVAGDSTLGPAGAVPTGVSIGVLAIGIADGSLTLGSGATVSVQAVHRLNTSETTAVV